MFFEGAREALRGYQPNARAHLLYGGHERKSHQRGPQCGQSKGRPGLGVGGNA